MSHAHPFVLLLAGLALAGCKKETATTPDPVAATDAALFAEATASGYTYYVGTSNPTPSRNNSAHTFERTRFNAAARAALDASGKLPVGATMPAGAVIVKEEYTTASGSLVQYAVMKKDPTSSLAGGGYTWAKYGPDGRVLVSVGDKGAGCVPCHGGSTNRDLMRSFDLN